MSRRLSQVIEVKLALTEDQDAFFRQLRDSPGLDDSSTSDASWFSIKDKFGVPRSITIPGSGFVTHESSITVPQAGELITTSPIRWRGVGLKKNYLCIVEKDFGWVAFISLARPKTSRSNSAKKRGRIYNDAAIFVTGKAAPRSVSGGLPSLGKRR